MRPIKIANKFIGPEHPVFFIAEAGVNHNGRLDLALRLVDKAAAAGADAVKFQTFSAAEVAAPQANLAPYQKGTAKNQLALLSKLELPRQFYRPILARCKKRKIIFLSTPHGGPSSVDFLRSLKVPAFKFGSGDLTNLPLLRYAARLKKPMIISTGMANMAEVKQAVSCIQKAGNRQIIILHCTTEYPCPDADVNLRAMVTMRQTFDLPVGYSDHTADSVAPLTAVTLGACVIEKHFTLNRRLPGPDHKASIEPTELKSLLTGLRRIDVILGSWRKVPTASEIRMRTHIRKSIVTTEKIAAGQRLSEQNLGIKRPGTGLAPKELLQIIGKSARRPLPTGHILQKNDYV